MTYICVNQVCVRVLLRNQETYRLKLDVNIADEITTMKMFINYLFMYEWAYPRVNQEKYRNETLWKENMSEHIIFAKHIAESKLGEKVAD